MKTYNNEQTTSIEAQGALSDHLQHHTAFKIQNSYQGPPKGVYAEVFGHSNQLSLNKLFDLNTPSMRKVDSRETRNKWGRVMKQ